LSWVFFLNFKEILQEVRIDDYANIISKIKLIENGISYDNSEIKDFEITLLSLINPNS